MAAGVWTDINAADDVQRDELSLTTFNIWNDTSMPKSVISRSRNCFRSVRPTSSCFRKSLRARSAFSSPNRGSGPTILERRSPAAMQATTACYSLPAADTRVTYTRLPRGNRAGSFKPISVSTEVGRSSAASISTVEGHRRGCARGSCAEYSLRSNRWKTPSCLAISICAMRRMGTSPRLTAMCGRPSGHTKMASPRTPRST